MPMNGGGHAAVDFDTVASRPGRYTVEPKVCESCTRQFFRSTVVPQRYREKFCRACWARMNKQPEKVQ